MKAGNKIAYQQSETEEKKMYKKVQIECLLMGFKKHCANFHEKYLFQGIKQRARFETACWIKSKTVSYTHLTLPTTAEV